MGTFFLHSGAHSILHDQYPEIYAKADEKAVNAAQASGMDRRRYSTWLYKVAESQIEGCLSDVKRLPLYDFADILGYLSSKDKYTEQMMKQ